MIHRYALSIDLIKIPSFGVDNANFKFISYPRSLDELF